MLCSTKSSVLRSTKSAVLTESIVVPATSKSNYRQSLPSPGGVLSCYGVCYGTATECLVLTYDVGASRSRGNSVSSYASYGGGTRYRPTLWHGASTWCYAHATQCPVLS
eukprot:1778367-Rhodomonas_salina.1